MARERERLLQHVALLLRREARTSDVIARLGGDEFAVIQPEAALAGGFIAAERIRATAFPLTRARAPIFFDPQTALFTSPSGLGKDRTTIATPVVPA